MKKYSMIHIPLMSFYARDLYRDVCLNWKGVGFIYLFLLVFVCRIPSAIRVHIGFSDFINNEAPDYVSQVPQITIEDGEAFVDANQPYHIIDPQTQEVLVIIDTTGTIATLEDTEAIGLITKHEAILRKSEYETRRIAFDEIDQFTLDQQRINGWLNTIQRYLAISTFPFLVVGSFIFRIIQLLIYAAIGILFASWCRSNRPYGSLLRLAVVAITPCIITQTVLAMMRIHIPFAGLLYFVAAMAYLFFGIKVSSGEDDDRSIEGLRVDDSPLGN
jgi:hypothetical protein